MEPERKRQARRKGTLKYPWHLFLTPQDFLTFVELDEFSDDWKQLGLDDDDLWALQAAIMVNPAGPPVVQGTGGLRKLRFAPERWNGGKSDGVRVCYVYFEQHAIALLVTVYDHGEKDNLSSAEKRGIREYIRQCDKWLSERPYK